MTMPLSQSTPVSQDPPKEHGRPLIIPIFLPHRGCPHQCLFCNQYQITGHSSDLPTYSALSEHIEQFLTFSRRKRSVVEVSFYGGNFLGLRFQEINAMLSYVSSFIEQGRIDGIRFSTRPDTIDEKRLRMIAPFPVSTVELGVQSMNDQVLSNIRRGHLKSDTQKAVGLLKSVDYKIGLQLMVGLPGDTAETLMESANEIAALQPDFVRIYPTLVLKGSPLARLYQKGGYSPLPLSKAVEYTKRLYLVFNRQNIPVIRMGLQASQELNQSDTMLAGPYHPAFGHMVLSAIYLDAMRRLLNGITSKISQINIHINPKDRSKAAGQKNQNIRTLKKEFPAVVLNLTANPNIAVGALSINGERAISVFPP